MELTIQTHAEGEGYWSEVVELPGCFASARTMTELLEAVGEAVGLYLWDAPAQVVAGDLALGESHIEVAGPDDREVVAERAGG
jgi:predicted RNase H-like HicB family nuclease